MEFAFSRKDQTTDTNDINKHIANTMNYDHWIERINSLWDSKNPVKSLNNLARLSNNCNSFVQKSKPSFRLKTSDTFQSNIVDKLQYLKRRALIDKNRFEEMVINSSRKSNIHSTKKKTNLELKYAETKRLDMPTTYKRVRRNASDDQIKNSNLNASNSVGIEHTTNKHYKPIVKSKSKVSIRKSQHQTSKSSLMPFLNFDCIFNKSSKDNTPSNNNYRSTKPIEKRDLAISNSDHITANNKMPLTLSERNFFVRCESERNFLSANISLSPNNHGDNGRNDKSKLVKRIVKIFSNLGNSNAFTFKKLVQTSLTYLSANATDNLVNLTAIHSMERIIFNLKNKISATKSLVSNTDCKSNSSERTSGTTIISNGISLWESDTVISFDLNGRVINVGGAIKSETHLNRYSLSNLSSLKSTNPSTYSIPTHYNGHRINSKLRKMVYPGQHKIAPKVKAQSMTRISYNTFNNNHRTKAPCRKKLTVAEIPRQKATKMQIEMNENGRYKMSIPNVSTFDFTKLNDIFLLKDDLFHKCQKSSLYVKPKCSANTNNLGRPVKALNNTWFLYIESPTKEALMNSIQLASRRFPEWKLG